MMKNMEFFHVFVLFSLSCGFVASDGYSLQQEVDILPTFEKAHYHLDELRKSLSHINSFQKISSRTKRDTHTAWGVKRYDILYDLLLDFCFNFQNASTFFEGEPPYDENTSDTAEPEYPMNTMPVSPEQSDQSGDELQDHLDIHPLRFVAVSEEDMVHVLLNVNHSVPFRVTRRAAFDSDHAFLDMSGGDSKRVIMSLARFSINTSTYCGNGYETDNVFSFESQHSSSKVDLIVNVCKCTDHENNNSDSLNDQLLVAAIDHKVRLPQFQVGHGKTSDPANVTVHAGKNETVNLTVQMDDRTSMRISAVFHDRSLKKMFRDEYTLILDENNAGMVQRISSESRQLFTVQVLNNSADLNGTLGAGGVDGTKTGRISIPIRLTLITESGHVTGKLYLEGASLQEGAKNNLSTCTVLQALRTQVIEVRKPGHPKVFPGRRVYMEKQSIFLCNQEGNVNHDKIGRNCTLSCSAVGRSVHDISIAKETSSDAPIHRSLTYKSQDRTSLLVDVGAASDSDSDSISGDYVCTVTTSKGKTQTQKLLLYSRPPEIDVNHTTLDDLGNGTSAVTCAATGHLPMGMRVEVGLPSKQLRIDNETTSSQRLATETEKGLTLRVEISTDILHYPAESIVCIATNDLGSANHTLLLTKAVITNEDLKPQILANESGILLFENGTTTITCAAWRASLLEVTLSSDNDSASVSLDSISGLTRTEVRDDDKRTVTWSSDIDNLVRTSSWLYCVAVNQHGVGYFKLRS